MAKQYVDGVEKVCRALNAQITKLEKGALKGLVRGAVHIRREMEFTMPVIPVDLGNLRSSFYTVTVGGAPDPGGGNFKGEDAAIMAEDHDSGKSESQGFLKSLKNPAVILGFTANYAWSVHEMVGATFRRPGAGAKFLESAIKTSTKRVLELVELEVKKELNSR